MVLSLSVPSFHRSSSTAAAPCSTSTSSAATTARRGSTTASSTETTAALGVRRDSSTGSTAGKRAWGRSTTISSPAASSPSPAAVTANITSSTSSNNNNNTSTSPIPNPSITLLNEALRNNPFGSNTPRARGLEANIREFGEQQLQQQQREHDERNEALVTLARIFPDVKAEVFRELLVRFDGRSRLQVCVEQLLRYKKEWVAGRWNVCGDGGDVAGASVASGRRAVASGTSATGSAFARGRDGVSEDDDLVPPEELFRTEEYKGTLKMVLAKEFSSLSKSTLDAVLAEVNFSYARARPILRDLSKKTWRATFSSILPSFKRKKDKDDHPLLVWYRSPRDGELVPKLKETGCEELDRELHASLLAPLLRQRKEAQEERDFQFAEEVNESEAQAVDALFECECCLGDVTFERISTCSASGHLICFSCIQRTVQEALFGQGWGKSVDLARSTLKCLAPVSPGFCDGSLQSRAVKRAVTMDKSGYETYRKFEDRLASEVLLKSQMKLVRCPFCSYAEVDPAYHPSARGISWRFRRDGLISTIVMIVLLLDLIPLFVIPLLIALLFDPSAISAVVKNSVLHMCLKLRPKRFVCASPCCKRASCLTCRKPWRDPHVCDEPLLLDLRATVEAARTAAVKRTCPRCGLSFVKSSGCNKLTCVCGYSMCYLCRKALGPPANPAAAQVRRRRSAAAAAPAAGGARPRAAAPWNQENIPHNGGGRAGPAYNNHDLLNNSDEHNQPLHDEIPEDEETDMQEIVEEEQEEPEGYKHFCEHFRINPGSRCTECTKCDLYEAEDEEAVARRAGEKAEREWRLRHGASNSSGSGSNNNNGSAGLSVRNVNVNSDFSSSVHAGGMLAEHERHGGRGGGYRGGGGRNNNNNARRRRQRSSWPMPWDIPLLILFGGGERTRGHGGGYGGGWRGWQYWLHDVWFEGRWKGEGQAVVDWLVERVIIIDDV